jgi:hypothetical protein
MSIPVFFSKNFSGWVSRLMTFKRSSFFVKFLHLMFVKIYDVVYVACYEIFIKDDDDDDDGW